MKGTATVSFCFGTSGGHQRFAKIQIEDAVSGCLVVELELSMEQLGMMLSSTPLKVPVQWRGLGMVNWRRVMLQRTIEVPDGPFAEREQRVRDAVDKEAEKVARETKAAKVQAFYQDATNPHRLQKVAHRKGKPRPNPRYKVTFWAFFPPESKPEAKDPREIKVIEDESLSAGPEDFGGIEYMEED